MKTLHKVIIGVGVGTAVIYLGVSIYHLIKSNRKSDGKQPPTGKSKPGAKKDNYTMGRKPTCQSSVRSERATATNHRPPKDDEFPLRLGSEGPRVERLQVWLMRNYGWTGIITSKLDEKTELLMKKYLKTNQLDKQTYQRLGIGKWVYEQATMH